MSNEAAIQKELAVIKAHHEIINQRFLKIEKLLTPKKEKSSPLTPGQKATLRANLHKTMYKKA